MLQCTGTLPAWCTWATWLRWVFLSKSPPSPTRRLTTLVYVHISHMNHELSRTLCQLDRTCRQSWRIRLTPRRSFTSWIAKFYSESYRLQSFWASTVSGCASTSASPSWRSEPSGWRRATPARTLPTLLLVSLVPSTREPLGLSLTSVTRWAELVSWRLPSLRSKFNFDFWRPYCHPLLQTLCDPKMKRVSYIGVLDIAGFEIFGRENLI